MKKALVLVLVTLVQSQSDGVLLPDSEGERLLPENVVLSDPSDSPSAKDLEDSDWTDLIKDEKRSLVGDSLTRRSALDKNFMRFGRGGDAQKPCGRRSTDGRSNFYRFGRGLKDNFIRFGRSRDNFIRFGRGGGKDGFIRFGRTRPEDFFRAGKSVRENFIRFGKADKNFMRFGKREDENESPYSEDLENSYQRAGKSSNFMRFGKNGKNGTNFLRFGKSEEEPEEKRKKRDVSNFRNKGATGYFEIPLVDYPRRVSEDSWGGLDTYNNNNIRLTPFFPVLPNYSKNVDSLAFDEEKRNQGGSNFIRFG